MCLHVDLFHVFVGWFLIYEFDPSRIFRLFFKFERNNLKNGFQENFNFFSDQSVFVSSDSKPLQTVLT